MKFLAILIFLISFSFFIKFSSAQSDIERGIAPWLGIPDSDIPTYLEPPGIIYWLILPLIALIAVTLGLMREVGIFQSQRNLQTTIAVVMALSTLPSHVLYITVSVL